VSSAAFYHLLILLPVAGSVHLIIPVRLFGGRCEIVTAGEKRVSTT
jgi:hypothetical protein